MVVALLLGRFRDAGRVAVTKYQPGATISTPLKYPPQRNPKIHFPAVTLTVLAATPSTVTTTSTSPWPTKLRGIRTLA